MSRLTESELTHLEMFGANDVRGDMSRRIWSVITELRERRAADLTDFDRALLRHIRDNILTPMLTNSPIEAGVAAMDVQVLSRILGAK